MSIRFYRLLRVSGVNRAAARFLVQHGMHFSVWAVAFLNMYFLWPFWKLVFQYGIMIAFALIPVVAFWRSMIIPENSTMPEPTPGQGYTFDEVEEMEFNDELPELEYDDKEGFVRVGDRKYVLHPEDWNKKPKELRHLIPKK